MITKYRLCDTILIRMFNEIEYTLIIISVRQITWSSFTRTFVRHEMFEENKSSKFKQNHLSIYGILIFERNIDYRYGEM